MIKNQVMGTEHRKQLEMGNEEGSILLEYVLVVCLLGGLVMGWSLSVYTVDIGLGSVGREIIQAYQRIMAGLSLPVP